MTLVRPTEYNEASASPLHAFSVNGVSLEDTVDAALTVLGKPERIDENWMEFGKVCIAHAFDRRVNEVKGDVLMLNGRRVVSLGTSMEEARTTVLGRYMAGLRGTHGGASLHVTFRKTRCSIHRLLLHFRNNTLETIDIYQTDLPQWVLDEFSVNGVSSGDTTEMVLALLGKPKHIDGPLMDFGRVSVVRTSDYRVDAVRGDVLMLNGRKVVGLGASVEEARATVLGKYMTQLRQTPEGASIDVTFRKDQRFLHRLSINFRNNKLETIAIHQMAPPPPDVIIR